MANDLNQYNFIGKLDNASEVCYLLSGDTVANLSLAVGSKWEDLQGVDHYRTKFVIDNMQMLDSRQSNNGQTSHQHQNLNNSGNSGYQSRKPSSRIQQNTNSNPARQQYQQTQHNAQMQQPKQNYTPDLDGDWDDDIPFAPIELQYPALLLCR